MSNEQVGGQQEVGVDKVAKTARRDAAAILALVDYDAGKVVVGGAGITTEYALGDWMSPAFAYNGKAFGVQPAAFPPRSPFNCG